jgi:hypothetical protein
MSDSRLRRWAIRRARQLAMVVLILTTVMALGACGVMLRRATCLIELPDVGDPFDFAAFRSFKVPADQDAFANFRQAASKLRPMPPLPTALRRAGPTVSWAQADEDLRGWVTGNQEALQLFCRGAERADGNAAPLENPLVNTITDLNLGQLACLAYLNASRLEHEGDMSGAWAGYRAILRSKAHVIHRGTAFDRFAADYLFRGLEPRVAAWSSHRKTDAALIRRALEDVHATEPKPEWEEFSLKLDYLQMTSTLDRRDRALDFAGDENHAMQFAGEPLPPELANALHAAQGFLINEPERSRRVLRLAFANWLSHIREQDPGRRKPAVRVIFSLLNQSTYLPFYAVGAVPRTTASAITPSDLASWLLSTHDAKALLRHRPLTTIAITEKREHRALVVALAEELYHRDHGSRAPSEESLVGTYLDHLPDDGSSDFDDGTAIRIDDSTAARIAWPD